MSAILGVDPGKDGGVCLLWSDGILIESMFEDPLDLARFLRPYENDIKVAYVEEPGIAPNRTAIQAHSALKQGRGVGQIEGILIGRGIKFKTVWAQSWSNRFPHGVKEKDDRKRYSLIKAARARIVQEMFPKLDLRANERCKNPHDGIVDAILIAAFGRLKEIEDGEKSEAC